MAPTRFAAGIPLKVYDAAAHGLPTVVTSVLARSVGWQHECETLVADTPQAFADACQRLHDDAGLWERIRGAALDAVKRDCRPETFDKAIANLLSAIRTARR